MAGLYAKPDPKGKTPRERWTTRFTVGETRIFASLGVLAPGSRDQRKLAQDRANRLEVECKSGAISPETRAWLGERAYRRIASQLTAARRNSGTMSTWMEAADAYIAEAEANDTVPAVEGKAFWAHSSRRARRFAIRMLAGKLTQMREPFLGRPFTEIAMDWAKLRAKNQIAPATVHTEIGYLKRWGDWLHSKGACEKPDACRINAAMPRRLVPELVLPSPQEDVASIRAFHKQRLDLYCGMQGPWSTWMLLLLVRGTGCRPSDAFGLDWQTVLLDQSLIRFKRPKEHARSGLPHRTTPILFQWALDGLREAWERAGKPLSGAVCLDSRGLPWESEQAPARRMQSMRATLGVRSDYTMKRAQKCIIRQLIQMGFPPHAVARWTGHTLTVQERHYCEEEVYIMQSYDYEEFGKLTELGKQQLRLVYPKHILDQLSNPSKK